MARVALAWKGQRWMAKSLIASRGSALHFAVPVLAVTIVALRHVLQAEIYGDVALTEPAVLRPTGEFPVPKTKIA